MEGKKKGVLKNAPEKMLEFLRPDSANIQGQRWVGCILMDLKVQLANLICQYTIMMHHKSKFNGGSEEK